MKTMGSILTILAVSLSVNLAYAQPVQLSLKDALNYAVKNSTNLRKAQLKVESGKYKVDETRALALPQIVGTGNFTNQIIKPQFVLPGDALGRPGELVTLESGTNYNTNVGVTINQQLFNQQVFTGLQAAKASEEFYKLNAELSEENVILQSAIAYYQVLVSKQQINVINANIKSLQQLEKTVNEQFVNGLAKRIDVDRVKVNLTNLLTQRDQLLNAITQQENTLKYIIGMPIETSISIPETELKQIEIQAAAVLTDSMNTQKRTEYRLLKKQETLLHLQKKAYQAERYPTLGLVGNYSYNGISDKLDLFRSNGTAFWYDVAYVGLSLRIPIFNGGATNAKVKQANIDILQLKEDLIDTRQSLNLANENAKIQIRNNAGTINAQASNVKLAEEIYNSTQSNYKNGLATLSDLLDAETARTAAQNSYSQALLNYKIAEIQLTKSTGEIKSLLN